MKLVTPQHLVMENWESELLMAFEKASLVMERAQKHPVRAGDTKDLTLEEQRAPAKEQS